MTSTLSRVLALTAVLWLPAAAPADPDAEAPTAEVYIQCTAGCQEDFYFSGQSEPVFARFRTACIESCAYVPESAQEEFRGCARQCAKTHRYLHGTAPEFADFQEACISGCRNVRPGASNE